LLTVSFPLLKQGGTLIAYKGNRIEEEVAEALPVLREVGGEFIQVKRLNLAFLEGEKTLILTRKAP
jgi:16S rRNA G527 N7-methylase RsmG